MKMRASVLLAFAFMIGKVHGLKDDVWYEPHTTKAADAEPPDMVYQNILFEATETLLSSKYQLNLIMDAYNNTDWTTVSEMEVFPELFNKTALLLDDMNRTLTRKVDLGYYFVEKDLADPITRVQGDRLIECFKKMSKYVDKIQTDKPFEEKKVRKGFVEMRLQINTAIQELENTIPGLLEQMRLFRNQVTEGPY